MSLKKIINIILIGILSINMTGCIKSDLMEDITIYTTVYPVEYITERLYGEHSSINSIYPDGVDVKDYTLTQKQIKDYSDTTLFIFNGLNSEKEFVTKFFEYNKKIKIIDSTSSMEIINRVEELWLNPSNFLMIAQNIKNGFDEYLSNHYLKDSIEKNFNTLKIEVSNLDATFMTIAENAVNKTIIVGDDALSFLSKYGFNIISLDPDTTTKKTISQVKELLANGSSSTIFTLSNDEPSDIINAILDEIDIKLTYLHNLSNINENERNDKKTYLTIMADNIELIKNEVYN